MAKCLLPIGDYWWSCYSYPLNHSNLEMNTQQSFFRSLLFYTIYSMYCTNFKFLYKWISYFELIKRTIFLDEEISVVVLDMSLLLTAQFQVGIMANRWDESYADKIEGVPNAKKRKCEFKALGTCPIGWFFLWFACHTHLYSKSCYKIARIFLIELCCKFCFWD